MRECPMPDFALRRRINKVRLGMALWESEPIQVEPSIMAPYM